MEVEVRVQDARDVRREEQTVVGEKVYSCRASLEASSFCTLLLLKSACRSRTFSAQTPRPMPMKAAYMYPKGLKVRGLFLIPLARPLVATPGIVSSVIRKFDIETYP